MVLEVYAEISFLSNNNIFKNFISITKTIKTTVFTYLRLRQNSFIFKENLFFRKLSRRMNGGYILSTKRLTTLHWKKFSSTKIDFLKLVHASALPPWIWGFEIQIEKNLAIAIVSDRYVCSRSSKHTFQKKFFFVGLFLGVIRSRY